MVKLKNICKVFKSDIYNITALDNINLEINDGEFVCIMGESGSGKSTMLNIIGCMDIPTKGEYYLNNKLVNSLKSKELSRIRNEEISFIFQDFALMNDYNAIENIELPLLKRKMSRRNRKLLINKYLEDLNISELKYKKPTQMSGGQQQRIAIARALVAETNIIIADEPTGALDSKTTRNLMDIFSKINKNGKTLIMVTHDENVASYADRVIRIADGRII